MTYTDKLKRLAEAATKGPWEASGSTITDWNQEECSFTMEFISNGGPVDQEWSNEDNDAAYIAAANPQAILALIAENERLEELYDLTGWQCDVWMSRAKSAEKQRDKAMQSVSIWIEEHDRIKFERDEAVALLCDFMNDGDTSSVYNDVRDFLARMDTKGSE